MTETSRYAGVARPVAPPESYGWWQLLLPAILAFELALVVFLIGRP